MSCYKKVNRVRDRYKRLKERLITVNEGLRIMDRRLNVADFAALVGTTAKTIYEKINNHDELPVIEQLNTVIEKVKGRSIKLILTNSEQIEYYKNLYSKDTVIDGEYYETLTDNNGDKTFINSQDNVKTNNNSSFQSDLFDKFITVNNEFNNRLKQLTDELIMSKSKMLLLEDKAGREGTYINEINILKKENNRNQLLIKLLTTVIITLLIVIVGYITFTIGVNNSKQTTEQPPAIEQSK